VLDGFRSQLVHSWVHSQHLAIVSLGLGVVGAVNEWLGPVLGLIGTLVVAGLGFFQWRKTAERKRQSEFESKRAEVLQGLVERLQDVQLVSRERTSIDADINDQVKPINEYLIRNQIWLEPEDGQFAKQYMNALLAIHGEIQHSGKHDLDLYVGTEMPLFSSEVSRLFGDLGRAQDQLVSRTRRALERKSVAASN